MIAIFGLLYTTILYIHNYSNAVYERNLEDQITVRGGERTEMGFVLAGIVFAMDIIFALWILLSLQSTLLYLNTRTTDGNDQDVLHHQALATLIAINMCLLLPLWIIKFLDIFEPEAILTSEQWIFANASMQGIYTFTLAMIAMLWRPSWMAEVPLPHANQQQDEGNGGSEDRHKSPEDVDDPMDLWNYGDVDLSENDDKNDSEDPDALPIDAGELS